MASTTLAATPEKLNPKDMRFVNVVKLTSSAWFTNMYRGEVAFSKATGVKVSQTGPAQATAEGQVSIIQNLIPQKPTAIGVDPNSEQALEGVLGRAQKAGIFVFSQEAPQLKNTDLDLEAFSNATYGREMMDTLAKCMGDKGQYVTFVGHLTAASHMAWAQGELAEAKAKFPDITRVTGPVVAEENSEVAYEKTKELLAKYPHLKGFLGSAATDIPGIARAVTEAGLSGKVCIVGTSIPSLTKTYVDAGTIQAVFLWDSSLTAHAVMNGALMMIQGKKVGPGTDLGVPGYTDIENCTGKGSSPRCFEGNAILKLTKKNIGEYHF
ncbi:MAG: autoinducer 2 ABC transporter substrate-binding protein [Acetobacteraceae bacterium]